MLSDLAEIITRKQDQLRGRPRNWRDDLSDWWQRFSFETVLWRVYLFLVLVWLLFAVAIYGFILVDKLA